MIVSKENAPVNQWGENSVAYLLCNSTHLTVKHEVMAAGDSERLHYHHTCMQCFFVLKGSVELVIDETSFWLKEYECITVMPGSKHLVKNVSFQTAEFLVISHPAINTDRVNII